MTPQEEFAQLHKKWAAEKIEQEQTDAAHELERRIGMRELLRAGKLKGHFAECFVCGIAILSLNHDAACPIGRADTRGVIDGRARKS
jgi:rubrerythrin